MRFCVLLTGFLYKAYQPVLFTNTTKYPYFIRDWHRQNDDSNDDDDDDDDDDDGGGDDDDDDDDDDRDDLHASTMITCATVYGPVSRNLGRC